YWQALELSLARGIFPGNIKHVGTKFAGDKREACYLILLRFSWPSIYPGAMGYDRCLFGRHTFYRVKSNVSLRGPTPWSFVVFQKDRQNLDGLEHSVGQVRQF